MKVFKEYNFALQIIPIFNYPILPMSVSSRAIQNKDMVTVFWLIICRFAQKNYLLGQLLSVVLIKPAEKSFEVERKCCRG